jgi:hypothetical protein
MSQVASFLNLRDVVALRAVSTTWDCVCSEFGLFSFISERQEYASTLSGMQLEVQIGNNSRPFAERKLGKIQEEYKRINISSQKTQASIEIGVMQDMPWVQRIMVSSAFSSIRHGYLSMFKTDDEIARDQILELDAFMDQCKNSRKVRIALKQAQAVRMAHREAESSHAKLFTPYFTNLVWHTNVVSGTATLPLIERFEDLQCMHKHCTYCPKHNHSNMVRADATFNNMLTSIPHDQLPWLLSNVGKETMFEPFERLVNPSKGVYLTEYKVAHFFRNLKDEHYSAKVFERLENFNKQLNKGIEQAKEDEVMYKDQLAAMAEEARAKAEADAVAMALAAAAERARVAAAIVARAAAATATAAAAARA